MEICETETVDDTITESLPLKLYTASHNKTPQSRMLFCSADCSGGSALEMCLFKQIPLGMLILSTDVKGSGRNLSKLCLENLSSIKSQSLQTSSGPVYN